MRIRCHAAALSGISRLGGLRSAPLPECAARRGEGRERTGVFISLFSQEPWPSMKAAAVALRPILFSGFGGEREGKGNVALFKQQQKNPHLQSQTAKKLINKWPCSLGLKESSPFHLAPAGPINPLSHFVSCVQRAPRLRLRTGPVPPARGRERATTKARRESKGEEGWQRGPRETRCQWHCRHNQM